MRGSTSRGSALGSGTRLWLASAIAGLFAAAGCAGRTGPAGTALSCASPAAEDALLDSDVSDQLAAEWLLERADCRAHNLTVLGAEADPEFPTLWQRVLRLFRQVG